MEALPRASGEAVAVLDGVAFAGLAEELHLVAAGDFCDVGFENTGGAARVGAGEIFEEVGLAVAIGIERSIGGAEFVKAVGDLELEVQRIATGS